MGHLLILMSVLTAAAATGAGAAERAVAAGADNCLRSINVIGASMGHVEKKGPGGKPMLAFVVRANGAEYDVLCEPETGLVRDVSLRGRGGDTQLH